MQQELKSPGEPAIELPLYTTSLPTNQPVERYRIHRSGGMYTVPLYTVYAECGLPKGQTHTVMLVRPIHSPGKWPTPLIMAYAWRPADYPTPFMNLVAAVGNWWERIGFKAHIDGFAAPLTVTEHPDMPETAKWHTPRRFSFGGRRFVWKPRTVTRNVLARPDWDIFEYTTTTATESSKTTKIEDDALMTRILWTEDCVEQAFCVAGLDPILKEYLLALAVVKRAVKRYRAELPPTAPGRDGDAEIAAKTTLMGAATFLVALLGAI